MRIYMVMSVLGPIGGIEAALLPLVLELQSRGNEVFVYLLRSLQRPNQNADALCKANIPILVAPAWLTGLARACIAFRLQIIQMCLWLSAPGLWLVSAFDATYRRRSLRRSFQGAWGRLQGTLASWLTFENLYYLRLNRAFRQKPPDVIHVHGWGCGEDPPGALHWLQRYDCPVIYTEHNSPDPAFHAEIPNAPMNLADVIVAVSQAARVGLYEVGHASPPIQVIPYSVVPLQMTSHRRDNQPFVVTCVARLHRQKGHQYLLEAFRQLVKTFPDAQLVLAGTGELGDELERRCVELGIRSNVEFLGVVARAGLPDLYANTDVVALASLWEGLPVTLIEALSAGMPIVATDVGGNAELVIDGVNGFVVPPREPTMLAASLTRLANDPDLRKAMSEASRRLFTSGGFSPAAVADRHLDAYRLAAERRESHGAR